MNYDVIVIGGGMAGYAAALRAAEKGASVALVSRAPGATFMHSGMFEIDADPFRPRSIAEPENSTLEHNIARTAAGNPHHPYAIIENAAEKLRDALKFFLGKMSGAGLELAGARENYLLIGNNAGTLKRVRICLATMAGGDFSEMSGARLLAVGPRGLDSFDPAFAAQSLMHLANRARPGTIEYSAGETIQLQQENIYNLSTWRAAEIIGRKDAAKKQVDALAALVKKHTPTHIAFPAIMGIERPGAALKLVTQRLGVPCFELAGTPPSVHGMRLQNALEKAARDAGINVVSGKVKGFKSDGRRVTSVSVDYQPSGDEELSADAFVLATGKFTAGGLRRDESLVETVFGLPTFHDGVPAADIFMYDLVTPKIAEKQPVFSCGVKVGGDMRPLNNRGSAVWSNLFCAGSVIGGYDPLRDRCGSGVAIVTGFTAGDSAASQAIR
jgi:glycerol-3-phosphate dehydrogenase subunit B